MGCGLDDAELQQQLTRLAHELADAHALLNAQQRKRAYGQHLFNAKQLAYGLLHKMHKARQREIVALSNR